MAYGNVNVSGPTQSEIEGVQQNIDDVKEVIGQTTNTGGTLTAGTVMAKLNKLLTDWTSARASKIDTINTNAANLNTRLTSTRAAYLDKLSNFAIAVPAVAVPPVSPVAPKLESLSKYPALVLVSLVLRLETFVFMVSILPALAFVQSVSNLFNFSITVPADALPSPSPS